MATPLLFQISLTDIIMILAIFLGPIVAVRLTRYLDDRKEKRERKLRIFKTLMTTRATALSPQHVEALNTIDLEFDVNNKYEKDVIEAWKVYIDLLNTQNIPLDYWGLRRIDLLTDLLHKMAIVLDFYFDKVHIKNSSYYPRGHSELEDDQTSIRRGFRELLEGKRVIPMYVTNFPLPQSSAEEQTEQNNSQIS